MTVECALGLILGAHYKLHKQLAVTYLVCSVTYRKTDRQSEISVPYRLFGEL